MTLIDATYGCQNESPESMNEVAAPEQICTICCNVIIGKGRQCDSCSAAACQLCAKTEWEWNESESHVRHKCSMCKKQTVTSVIVQQCLNRAESAAKTDPGLSLRLFEVVSPWLSKEQKAAFEDKQIAWESLRIAHNASLEAAIKILERRAQDLFDRAHTDKALELWEALYEIRPDDEHICTMMVKTQVSCNEVEKNESTHVEKVLAFIKLKLQYAIEVQSFDVVIILSELALQLRPNDVEMVKLLKETELVRSEQLENFQPSPVAAIKASLQQELDDARSQGDIGREASLMNVLRATLIQEHRHYQNLGKPPT